MCTHAEGIRYTSQIRSLTIRPRDEYELRRPRAAISALTDRPSLGRETLRFPSSLVRSVADAGNANCPLVARKRSFVRIGENSRPGCDHGQVRGVNSANRKPECRCRRVIECWRWRSSSLSRPRPLFTFARVYRVIIVRADYSIVAHSRTNLRSSRFGFLTLWGKEIRSVCKLLIFVSCLVYN